VLDGTTKSPITVAVPSKLQNTEPILASVATPDVPAFAITTPIAPLVNALAGFAAHPAVVSTANPFTIVPFVVSLHSS
jgi:hypothetical protein